MASIHQVLAGNRLLDALPDGQRSRMVAACEPLELMAGEVIYAAGERLSHVHFPTRCTVSLAMPRDVAPAMEVGLVGSEGMVGIPLALGTDVSLSNAVVLRAGRTLRMDAVHFCRELRRSDALQGGIHRYIYVRLQELARSTTCARFHVVEERLARWLLMAQDRAGSRSFHVTHDSLASRLGVRRAGISKAAFALKAGGLIAYSRGEVTIRDRRGLRDAACTCYVADRASYDRILG